MITETFVHLETEDQVYPARSYHHDDGYGVLRVAGDVTIFATPPVLRKLRSIIDGLMAELERGVATVGTDS